MSQIIYDNTTQTRHCLSKLYECKEEIKVICAESFELTAQITKERCINEIYQQNICDPEVVMIFDLTHEKIKKSSDTEIRQPSDIDLKPPQ